MLLLLLLLRAPHCRITTCNDYDDNDDM